MADVGRPRLIESPEQMLALGQAYFEECKANDDPITLTGLVLALGLSSRQSLELYAQREEFIVSVKSLKTVCENYTEKKALATNGAGAIFALKNYGWTDKLALGGAEDLPPIQAAVTVEFVKPKTE